MSAFSPSKFWIDTDEQSRVHPLDEHGVRHRYQSTPGTLDKLS